MTQQSLFNNFTPAPLTKIEKRHAAAAKVHDKESELWKQMYRAFVLKYALDHSTFTPETVRHAYSAQKHLPQPENWRSAGQMFKILTKEGYLKRVEMGISKDFGCPTPVYTRGDK